ncbi:MAG: ORC1-type DNA replication protein, partial [Candidatus Bathyarchaeia archaeon]
GNARFGIDLLWRAGKYADADGLDSVTPDCVRKAVSSVVPAMRKSELAALGFHEKLLLLGIARCFKENHKAYISLSEAEQFYAVVCEEFNERVHSHTQLWKHLQTLSSLGVVKTEVSTVGSRGRTTLICLPKISAEDLEKELSAIIEKEKA